MSKYRFGFNGYEKDDEVKGLGRHLGFADYGYDPATGRRWNIDPLAFKMSWQSPYTYAANNPIENIDANGESPLKVLKLIKRGYNIYLDLKKAKNLSPKTLAKSFKENGIDELIDIAGDVITVFDSKSSFIDKAKAIIDLAGFTELNNKGADKIEDIFKGTKGGKRAVQDFTSKGKKEVIDANKTKNSGKSVCEGCGTNTTDATKSTKGKTPSGDETRVDHSIPKSQGGDGAPSNGKVLCNDCNTVKSDATSIE